LELASARTPCKLKQTSLYGVITLAGGLKGQNGPTTQSDVRQIIDLLIPSAIIRGRHANTVLGGLAAVFDDLDDLALEVHHSIFMTPSLSRMVYPMFHL
jgi:hypothetical protein